VGINAITAEMSTFMIWKPDESKQFAVPDIKHPNIATIGKMINTENANTTAYITCLGIIIILRL